MADNESDDLRSLLSKSFDDNMASTALSDGVIDAPAPKAKTEVEPAAEPKAGEDRPRGPDGKFAKKDGEADVEPDAKPAPEAKKKDEPEAKPDAKSDVDPDKQPDAKVEDPKEKAIARWSASDKAMFRLQSPEAQDFLIRRNSALEAEFTKRNQAIADLKRDYEPVQQLFAPHSETLKQKGLNPASVIQRWASVETDLASGDPARQLRIIAGIVQGYGIDRNQIAQALGLQAAGAPAAQDPAARQQPGADDPVAQALAALEQKIAQTFAPKFAKIDQWEQTQQQRVEAARVDAMTRVDNEINEFKRAADANGNPLHPYYDEVEPAMIALAQSYQASGTPIPKLPDLYETAVWANPSTRQALLATQKAAQEAKAMEEARAKSRQAQRAASSVTGAPGSGQATRPVRSELSLREQLEEAVADLN